MAHTDAEQPAQPASTASPEEVARFAAMAEEWWDPNGKFKPLHRFNPSRIAYIRHMACQHFERDPSAAQPFKGLNVLDIGCGGGLVSEPVAKLGPDMTSIDASEKNIRIAQAHADETNVAINYRHALPEDLAAEGKTFDLVLNLEVIEHVPDISVFVETCCKLVRPGGVMIFATLNRTIKSLALAKIGAEYILRWMPPGTHDWKKFVKPSELAAELRPLGFSVQDLKGMSFNPLLDAWSLTPNLDVNYLAFTVNDNPATEI